MEIGSKIKRLRVRLGLTQEELAARTELTKGFISQLERDITSPSIATLMDILEALGTNVSEFFSDREDDGVLVYSAEDMFIKEDEEAGVIIAAISPPFHPSPSETCRRRATFPRPDRWKPAPASRRRPRRRP